MCVWVVLLTYPLKAQHRYLQKCIMSKTRSRNTPLYTQAMQPKKYCIFFQSALKDKGCDFYLL